MGAIKTILHPTDFSEPSRYALDIACRLASHHGASLVIIHAVRAQGVFSDGVLFLGPERALRGVRNQLDGLEVPDDAIDVIRRVEEANPVAEILNLARLCRADLIVMGSHGRNGLHRWFLGSVTEAVMRTATCPVLTVTTQFPSRSGGDGSMRNQAAQT